MALYLGVTNMSLHIEFEPHSWYRGFAIEKPEHNDPENYNRYYAYTDNGNTYRVDTLQADTLKELKQLITLYRSK